MRLLPTELFEIIHQYSQTGLFWRYCALSKFTQQLPTLPDTTVSFPLRKILAWKRGSLPEITDDNPSPIIRLTIDSLGIKKIESLARNPEFESWRTDYLAYIITDRSSVDGTVAHYKVREKVSPNSFTD